jgi:hypothetical protein
MSRRVAARQADVGEMTAAECYGVWCDVLPDMPEIPGLSSCVKFIFRHAKKDSRLLKRMCLDDL